MLRRVSRASGCHWHYVPAKFPTWQMVYYHFRQSRRKHTLHALYLALHGAERERVGRHPHPSAAIMDSQSVKTIKGRKRHLLVDTLGFPIAW